MVCLWEFWVKRNDYSNDLLECQLIVPTVGLERNLASWEIERLGYLWGRLTGFKALSPPSKQNYWNIIPQQRTKEEKWSICDEVGWPYGLSWQALAFLWLELNIFRRLMPTTNSRWKKMKTRVWCEFDEHQTKGLFHWWNLPRLNLFTRIEFLHQYSLLTNFLIQISSLHLLIFISIKPFRSNCTPLIVTLPL